MIYQIIAFILVTIFYLSFLFKIILLKRRKKIKVNYLGDKNNKLKNDIKFENILKVFSILMIIVQYFSIIINDNWYFINVYSFIRIIGLIIILLGIVLLILALIAIKDNFLIGTNPNTNTSLVTSGIYKISRNPIFLGFDLLYIGLFFVFPNPINLIFTIILVWLFDSLINIEESYLVSIHKDDYINYKSKVKKYFLFF